MNRWLPWFLFGLAVFAGAFAQRQFAVPSAPVIAVPQRVALESPMQEARAAIEWPST